VAPAFLFGNRAVCRLRLRYLSLFVAIGRIEQLAVDFIGKPRNFQAGCAGSIPVTRSDLPNEISAITFRRRSAGFWFTGRFTKLGSSQTGAPETVTRNKKESGGHRSIDARIEPPRDERVPFVLRDPQLERAIAATFAAKFDHQAAAPAGRIVDLTRGEPVRRGQTIIDGGHVGAFAILAEPVEYDHPAVMEITVTATGTA
jgi:hypothetical protein